MCTNDKNDAICYYDSINENDHDDKDDNSYYDINTNYWFWW